MIARDLNDEQAILIRQQDHADLAAQFASHWGNTDFSRSDHFDSVICAAGCHDDHFRDVEALPPIDAAHGRPFGHRTTPFSASHLDALQHNVAWIGQRDRYAALLVSMHHTGLPQNRYGIINSWQNGGGKSAAKRQIRPEVAAFIEKMEQSQRAVVEELGHNATTDKKQLWFNYRLLQLFDLLSLYLCCDGYADGQLAEVTLGPIPVALGSDQEINIRIVPGGDGLLRLDPYPFDRQSLKVSVMTRVVPRLVGHTEAECRAEYARSPRESLTWMITS